MKEILLTQGQIALVDDEDFDSLNKYKWYAYTSENRNTYYAIRNIPLGNGKQTAIRMHREILNAPKGIQVDHKNGNGLFNYKKNLRVCTRNQNMHNQKQAHKNNKLGIKGVSWDRNMKKFRAQIKVNNIKLHLGYFNVMGDADSVYRIAELKYFGEFARGKRKCLYENT